jgi:hypothetical protein
MEKLTHGFCTREGWTSLFTDYNMVISDLNEASYGLIQSDLPAEEWVERYKENSTRVREAFILNEEMLNQHVRWFTRQPKHWTRETADPLICSLFRYITRVQDLGTTYEIADSLIDFYKKSGDDIGLMKCYTVRAMSCAMLEPIHLGEDVWRDCAAARGIYERCFEELSPEEKSMGLSIYDLQFDHMTTRLKLGRPKKAQMDELVSCYSAAVKAVEGTLAVDRGYPFNSVLPDFDYHLSYTALCISPGQCSAEQAEAICQSARAMMRESSANPEHSDSYRIRTRLIGLMAERLLGLCTDESILAEMHRMMEGFAQALFEGGTHNQRSIEAVEAMQLAVENITHSGERERGLYDEIHRLFISYLSSRPYATFIDYICGSQNYCYILSAMPHYHNPEKLLHSLLRLTMFRQVQTAMHSIMVAKLSVEILNSVIDRRPELMAGQLGTSSAKEVIEKRNEFIQYIYCGALLHDIGKVLCSGVINAQSHRLGELEFCVLKYHPVTGGEMLEHLQGLSQFRDIALGHQKSFDGLSGYPPEFDNNASPQKIFIDIITICDSLDAATDHLGRNYTTAKEFDTVMDELRAGSGSRYSDVLVDLLDEDRDLCVRLKSFLKDGRRDVYFHVHQYIMSASVGSHETERTHNWLFDLTLAPQDK